MFSECRSPSSQSGRKSKEGNEDTLLLHTQLFGVCCFWTELWLLKGSCHYRLTKSLNKSREILHCCQKPKLYQTFCFLSTHKAEKIHGVHGRFNFDLNDREGHSDSNKILKYPRVYKKIWADFWNSLNHWVCYLSQQTLKQDPARPFLQSLSWMWKRTHFPRRWGTP